MLLRKEVRVAFSGASGTGKTTFATWLQKNQGLDLCPVGARETARALGFDSPYDVDGASARKQFNTELRVQKSTWETQRSRFVTDRSHLDNFVYFFLHGPGLVSKEEWDAHALANRHYTHIILFDASKPFSFCKPNSDPARIQDLTYHRLYALTLRTFLKSNLFHSQKLLEIDHGGFVLRRAEILAFLES